MRYRIYWMIGCLFVLFYAAQGQEYVITEFGARPGSGQINTEAINQAIRTCHQNGGGRVVVPAGTFMTGTIFMKDHVELHLSAGAVLLGSPDYKDYPIQPPVEYRSQKDPAGWRALIYGHKVKNIALTGLGAIDGNGGYFDKDDRIGLKGDRDGRPRNILFISCSNIRVEGIRMTNSAIWNQHYLNCEDVIVDRIEVYNHINRNNDGIDIDGCRRFVLSNSIFDTDDDGITLKSTGEAPTEDVVITNCIVSSNCNAIKAGTESTGGFRNITVSNCVVRPSRSEKKPIYGFPGGITGISLEIVDGGKMEGVAISNVVIEGTKCPLYIRLGNRARKHIAEAPTPPMGVMRNISIDNLTAYGTGNYTSSITAIPGAYVENLTMSNIRLMNAGNPAEEGYLSGVDEVKEDEKGYPQPNVWKNLPSSGLFIRHARDVQINGISLGSREEDPRIPVIAADVKGLQINGVGRVHGNSAPVFFLGKEVEEVDITKPLGWTGKVMSLQNSATQANHKIPGADQ